MGRAGLFALHRNRPPYLESSAGRGAGRAEGSGGPWARCSQTRLRFGLYLLQKKDCEPPFPLSAWGSACLGNTLVACADAQAGGLWATSVPEVRPRGQHICLPETGLDVLKAAAGSLDGPQRSGE